MRLASIELTGIDQAGLTDTLDRLEAQRFAQRMWHRDARLWKDGRCSARAQLAVVRERSSL